ncbi:Protein cwh43 [Coemansia sp. S142-1]|nr:Protein cwh43 [Coemansia sp. S142-1]
MGAFMGALVIELHLHYHKIVLNKNVGYLTSDRYHGYNVFQLLIALMCPSRLLLHALWYVLLSRAAPTRARALFGIGFLRTNTCGGWVYVTSSDDHDVHDVMMIAYMLLTLPYMILLLKSGDKSPFTHNTKELSVNRNRHK